MHGSTEAHHWRCAKIDQITFWALIVLGGTTVMLNDPLYLQWKLTVTFYLFAIIAAVNTRLERQPICQLLLGEKIEVPPKFGRHVILASSFSRC